MIKTGNNKKAIIILHEIYGVNKFIKEQCDLFREAGYSVFSPDLIGKAAFSYEESEEAYQFFMNKIGFGIYKEISALINRLKDEFNQVFVLGFSVGATIAWRCCENPRCSGIVACYGSRIRDYLDITPVCPTLVLVAKEDSFDVSGLILRLCDKKQVSLFEFDAKHGFMDVYSKSYESRQMKSAEKYIVGFLNTCAKEI